jgi:hypothetical protein
MCRGNGQACAARPGQALPTQRDAAGRGARSTSEAGRNLGDDLVATAVSRLRGPTSTSAPTSVYGQASRSSGDVDHAGGQGVVGSNPAVRRVRVHVASIDMPLGDRPQSDYATESSVAWLDDPDGIPNGEAMGSATVQVQERTSADTSAPHEHEVEVRLRGTAAPPLDIPGPARRDPHLDRSGSEKRAGRPAPSVKGIHLNAPRSSS